jgi:hypothetical protein
MNEKEIMYNEKTGGTQGGGAMRQESDQKEPSLKWVLVGIGILLLVLMFIQLW